MKIAEVIIPDDDQYELHLRGGGMIQPVDAFHGTRSDSIEGGFRPSTRGRFGPGVYSSLQPGVASEYGKMHRVQVHGNLFDAYPRFIPAEDTIRLRQNIFSLMSPEEQARVAEWWPENRGMTGEDVWEVIARRLGDVRAQEILKQMGYHGITGIGDGQEIVVFDPKRIRLAEPPM